MENEIAKIIVKRSSVRAFDNSKKIPKTKIMKILKAGTLAPSARNSQPWRFYVAISEEAKTKVCEAMAERNPWAKEANAIIVLLADKNFAVRPDEKKYYIDIGLCLENILLEAVNQGLGACACTAFDKELLTKALGLPEHLEAVVVVPLGYEAKGKKFAEMKRKYGEIVERRDHKDGTKKLEECIINLA
ncbi:MAG: nitroreductase family protein [Candidatus Diapherotrites archaeon]|nr:nitroreductase family protein [Candidatus Diapherotrites archaeon]